MSVSTSLRLLTCAVLLGLLPVYNAQTISPNCGQATFDSLRGNISSPNYPYSYPINQYCSYNIVAPSLSTIKFTFKALDLEQGTTCTNDYVQFSCNNSRPMRYCGSGYRAELMYKPCSRVVMTFRSDGARTGIGFSVSYNIEPIRCNGDCTPVTNSYGYFCSCDALQTTVIETSNSYCPYGCTTSAPAYCACSNPDVTPLTSTSTTVSYAEYNMYCGQSTYTSSSGNITSPQYPRNYQNNQFCNYAIYTWSLNTINFTFNVLGLEYQNDCTYDWIEFTCESNSISRPIRYCGSGYRAELSFKMCYRVLVAFRADKISTRIGFSVSYKMEPIRCQGNCTPAMAAGGYNYNCTCDANQSPYVAPPYDQCPVGCFISSTYCACSAPPTNTSMSTSTTSTPTSTISTTSTSTTRPTTTAIYYAYCGQRTFNGTAGVIASPSYPSYYGINQLCSYYIVATSLSTIKITFNAFGLEQHATCAYDWIEFTCESNSISKPVRYCGSGYRSDLIIKPCSRVLVTFVSDGSVTGVGFSVSFNVEPIRCQGACSPVSNGAGYNCNCDANQTPYIAPPYDQCPTGCSSSSTFCACSTVQTPASTISTSPSPTSTSTSTTPTSTSTTTTTTTALPTTTTAIYNAYCGQRTFNGTGGVITSPYYSSFYGNNQLCSYSIVASSLSTIKFIFNALFIEQGTTCNYDWIELTCDSNSISRPVRYCGSGYRSDLVFKPCSSVLVTFRSDGGVTSGGFSVSYEIEPIKCQGACSPVANGSGYNCNCDANQTPYIAPPYDQCPVGCFSYSTFCVCNAVQTAPSTTTTTSTSTSTTTTSTSTTPALPSYSYCGQSTFIEQTGNITSPGYPNLYGNDQFCSYSIVASSLSTFKFTFNVVDLEMHYICVYDWIEFTCESNSISQPIRYCGSGYRSDLIIKPCSRALVTFRSDGSATFTGFSVSYDIEPIRCQGACDPVSNGSGYNCNCDANQTPYIAPPYDQCPVGCYSAMSTSTYCACTSSSSGDATAASWQYSENTTDLDNSSFTELPWNSSDTTMN